MTPQWTLGISPEEVSRLYWQEGKTVKAIAQVAKVSENTVHRQMRLQGIPHKSRSEVNNQQWRVRGKPIRLSKEILEELYLSEQKSTSCIAAEFGVAAITVNSWLRQYSIPVRSPAEGNRLRNMSGSRNPAWKGGRRVRNGYIFILRPEHHRAMQNGYVAEHILVWEEAHGRRLPDGLVIHHYDGNPANNRPSNLLAVTKLMHRRLHRMCLAMMQELENQVSVLLERVILLEAELELIRAGETKKVMGTENVLALTKEGV